MELLTKEQLDEKLTKIEEMESVLKSLKEEVKVHNILTAIRDKFGEVELMKDIIQQDNGKRYVLVDINTQMLYNDSYCYVNIYGYQVRKDLTLSVRCVRIWEFYNAKVIGKLEDLQNE